MSDLRSAPPSADARQYLRVLRKRAWIVVLALLGSIAGGAFVTARADRIYESSGSLFIGQPQVARAQVAEGVQVANLSTQLLQSYAAILSSRSLAEKAVSSARLDIDAAEVVAGIQAVPKAQTQIIELSYRSTDPALAANVVNAVADAFVTEIKQLGGEGDVTDPAVRVSLIDRALVATAPVSPRPTINIAIAVLLGLAVGVGVAFLRERLDVTVKRRDEVEQLGIPVLGSVPQLETSGQNVYIEEDAQGPAGEAFRKLRTSIGFLGVDLPMKTVLVTSSVPEEGKTMVALNLAAAFASGGLRTLLIEADLRRPSLHRVFGTYGTRGLTTAIVGDIPIDDAIVHTDTRNLSVVLAGAIPPNPVELLGSEQMASLVKRLSAMFDMVIIDSPPLMPVADPLTLMRHCDGVVVVARAGKTDRRRLSDSVGLVERARGRFLGIVMNFLRPSESPDDYDYYHYGYGSRDISSSVSERGGRA